MNQEIFCPNIKYDIFENDNMWKDIPPAIKRFHKADGSDPADYNTSLKTCFNKENLYFKFICNDNIILSEYKNKGDPVYKQDAVEVFLAPKTKKRYFEIDISPKNVVYDALIKNNLQGDQFEGDPQWTCRGLRTKVIKKESDSTNFGDWEALFSIPFKSLAAKRPEKRESWYANFYRIKRKPQEEFSCWQPTKTDPANFHIPKFFGRIIFT